MKQRVMIVTCDDRRPWLDDCLDSLCHRSDLMVVNTPGWEVEKLRYMYEQTDVDEWYFIQDSMIIKDDSFIDEAFAIKGSVSMTECPVVMGMYIGKWCRSTLDKIEIPRSKDKYFAILNEVGWCPEYAALEGRIPVQFPEINDKMFGDRREERHGRTNLILENDFFKKWKGTWN